MTRTKSIIPTFFCSKRTVNQTFFPELTLKQFSVLELYALGVPTKSIHTRLEVSEATIREHLAAIRIKFGCTCTNEIRQVYLSRLINFIFNHITL
jgi:DNA-binding NarL/FixJ family response regulator